MNAPHPIPTAETVARPRAKPNHEERRLTILIADYLRAMAKPGIWWSHVPNGEYRRPATAALLKRMGLVGGCADFLLIVPKGVSMAMEVKREGTYQSPEQKAFQKAWEDAGNVYSIVRSLDEAIADFQRWGITRIDQNFVPAKGRGE